MHMNSTDTLHTHTHTYMCVCVCVCVVCVCVCGVCVCVCVCTCVCVLYINISKLTFISIIYENSVSPVLENPVCIHYKDQPVLAVQGSNWYYCENYMTHKDKVCVIILCLLMLQ